MDKDLKGRAKSEGITSVLVAPLTARQEIIGVVKFYAAAALELSEHDTKFIEAVANLSAIAFENARLHQALQTNYDLMVACKYRLDD